MYLWHYVLSLYYSIAIDMRLFTNLATPPGFYLDVFVQSVKVGSRVRCKPVDGQDIPPSYWVECSRRIRQHYPIGTIFKVDVRKVQPSGRKTYLAAAHRNELPRATEYFEHNLMLQQSLFSQ